MKHTQKDLKKIFLNKLNNTKVKSIQDRGMRKMTERLHEEFDMVWIKHNNNKATYRELENALDKWLNAEEI